ncbi:class I SAM-dependent methyltransferase [Microbacterium gorillae]|uniref:class I SAM-dependent methyltransferase n=1 Tax=Microbacterium gorillae TaxID=1231063 RepID=UPI000590F864|nr:class I SAM-dependent methyltransferase [Microbacterium gorillae]
MSTPSRSELAASFAATGEAYDRYRPGFPDAAVDLFADDDVHAALDLGAGTGKLTERLQGRVAELTAVEPAESMLAVLRRKLPNVTALLGTAEDIPVADASQDLVAVAQAFHWFDTERAAAEIARVLRPGGVLALLWNWPDPHCAWETAAGAIAHPASAAARAEEDPDEVPAQADLPGFTTVGAHLVPWPERISRTDYIERWATVSSFLAAAPDARAEMLAAVERILDEDPDTTGRTELDLPQRTLVLLYRRP